MRRIALLGMVAGGLAGCAAPGYVPPSGENTVRLEVKSSLTGGAAMTLFIYENGLACSSRQLLNGGTPSPSGSTSQVRLQNFETRLKSDTVQTIDGIFSQGNFYCRIAVSFYPEKNKIYTARPGYADGKCFVLIFDTTATVNGVLEKTLTKRGNGEPLLDGGAWCKPMAQSTIKDKLKSDQASAGIVEEATGGYRPNGPDRARGASLDDLQGLMPSNK